MMTESRMHAIRNPDSDPRLARLEALLREQGSVCVGYSGGVDSAFLAVFAVEVLGRASVLAVTAQSASVPRVQLDMAAAIARDFDLPHRIVATGEVSDPRYAANPSNRCYYCKTELWKTLAPIAEEAGLAVLIDGTNADDVGDHRPGARAAAEHGVRSPLLEAGLTKTEIREASFARGLPTWNAPASPCLASRLPYGVAVTPERLRQIETAEDALRARGYREFRVRHHGDAARLEFAPAELDRAVAESPVLAAIIRTAGFARVLLDVDGYRRGALNEGLPLVRLGV